MSRKDKEKQDTPAQMPEEPILGQQAEEETALPVEDASQPIDVEMLLLQLSEAEKQREEYLTLAQRVQADFDNYRRRNNSARAEAFDEGAKAFAVTLLPVIDNLERALEASDAAQDVSLKEGIQMVYRLLTDAFAKRGIEPISRLGEKFDPTLENAVMKGAPEEGEPGTVCAVLQKGYKMDKNVLRHAMVKVVGD